MLCFLETPVLTFAILPYYRRNKAIIIKVILIQDSNKNYKMSEVQYSRQWLEVSRSCWLIHCIFTLQFCTASDDQSKIDFLLFVNIWLISKLFENYSQNTIWVLIFSYERFVQENSNGLIAQLKEDFTPSGVHCRC